MYSITCECVKMLLKWDAELQYFVHVCLHNSMYTIMLVNYTRVSGC